MVYSPRSQENIDDNSTRQIDSSLRIDDTDQQLIELLQKGYTIKKIALHLKSPLSTLQKRTRRIFEMGYVVRKNELNYRKLELRKVYLMITLKGGCSSLVAQKISQIKGITFVSLVTGEIDILCICVFKYIDDLFKITENIKQIEGVDNVILSEEVNSVPIQETPILNFKQSKANLS
jgi:DNA-binding Lrp family transcriptional regulator